MWHAGPIAAVAPATGDPNNTCSFQPAKALAAKKLSLAAQRGAFRNRLLD
jgi:hypothetical protein